MLSVLERAFMEGYSTQTLDITTMFVCCIFTAVIALYICLVYRLVNRNTFFDRNFIVSLFGLSLITSAVILTIQSNIVVSLGMVGALSIVRFRTAIKNPMDLVFLFWSISVGIICGAGYAMISIIASVILTIGIVIFSVLPAEKNTSVLIVIATEYIEGEILEAVDRTCSIWKVRSRNIRPGEMSLAIEVKTRHPHKLVEGISALRSIKSISLVEHDGDVTA